MHEQKSIENPSQNSPKSQGPLCLSQGPLCLSQILSAPKRASGTGKAVLATGLIKPLRKPKSFKLCIKVEKSKIKPNERMDVYTMADTIQVLQDIEPYCHNMNVDVNELKSTPSSTENDDNFEPIDLDKPVNYEELDPFEYKPVEVNNDIPMYVNPADYAEEDLPKAINISTMTITAKLNTVLNIEAIYKHAPLSHQNIIGMKFFDRYKALKGYDIKTDGTQFFNQLTMIMNNGEKELNIKLFKSGSVQITGADSIRSFNLGIHKVMQLLTSVKYVLKPDKTMERIKWVENPDNLHVSDFKIAMINSNFVINYKINRNYFHEKLREENYDARYEPCIHACVNVKVKTSDNKTVSVFVFDTGKIIITGAQSFPQVRESYAEIMRILNHFEKDIKKVDFNSINLLSQ